MNTDQGEEGGLGGIIFDADCIATVNALATDLDLRHLLATADHFTLIAQPHDHVIVALEHQPARPAEIGLLDVARFALGTFERPRREEKLTG